MDNLFDQIFFFFIAFVVIGGGLKLLFWFSLISGLFRSLSSAQQQNPLLALFGVPQSPTNPALIDVQQRHRYALAGLTLGTVMILLGVIMIVLGVRGDASFSFLGMEVNQATPGVVFALLGTYVVKVTGPAK